MDFNNIDYKVHQYALGLEDGFMDYLKERNGGGLVKNYSINMNYTWDLAEKISEKYDFKLFKLQNNGVYQCVITKYIENMEMDWMEYKEGYAESEMASMAICLAIIDFFEGKDSYLEEAELTIQELKAIRETNRKLLEDKIGKLS